MNMYSTEAAQADSHPLHAAVDTVRTSLQHLIKLIDDGAIICQVIRGENTPGMALYNKQEFIDLLSMPSGSLKNIEVLGSRLKDEKIVLLRFRVREEKP